MLQIYKGSKRSFPELRRLSSIAVLVVGVLSAVAQEGNTTVLDTTSWRYKHVPRKASILSAVLPGAGQIYNRKYWKAPIVWAGVGVAVYYIDYNHSRFRMYKDALIAITDDDPNTVDPFNGAYPTSFIEANVDFHRRYRDLSYLGLVLVYALNIVDANVDAHFVRFNVSDELSATIRPSILALQNPTPSLSISFNLR